MTITKENFCKEARVLLTEDYILSPHSKNYIIFLDFLKKELKEPPFDDKFGETILMRDDAKQIVSKLIKYLSKQATNIKTGKEWSSDKNLISSIYDIEFYEVFKNIINPGTNLEGICYSLDLSIQRGLPSGFTLDRYYVKDEGKSVSVFKRGCIDMFYNRTMKVFTYEDKWN